MHAKDRNKIQQQQTKQSKLIKIQQIYDGDKNGTKMKNKKNNTHTHKKKRGKKQM